jgi:hypothetical protein
MLRLFLHFFLTAEEMLGMRRVALLPLLIKTPNLATIIELPAIKHT